MEEKKQILFVDDDPYFLKGLFRALHQMTDTWTMLYAESVDEALEIISQNAVDVVVTDFRMDGKDGLDLLRIINESEELSDIPVVMLTGSDESDLKRRALELGAADLLGKPVIREDLIARIKSVLRLKDSQDALKTMNQVLEIRVQERTAELEQSRLEMIWRLAKAGEYRDETTGNHVLRVGHFSRIIANELGGARDYSQCLFLTSPLHDIGKIGIPDAILNKPGKLTAEERLIMQGHCQIGAKILSRSKSDVGPLSVYSFSTSTIEKAGDNGLIEMAATVALRHHERWDGTGYPDRLAGNDIPLEALIVAVADVYDALSSDRPYKIAFPQDQVLSMMHEQSGLQFSPEVLAALESSLDEIESIRHQLKDVIVEKELEDAA
jgi:response regulator RpfG family c-di-GMP phosphodiesterase